MSHDQLVSDTCTANSGAYIITLCRILSARIEPRILIQMQEKLEQYQATYFDPDRGRQSPEACAVALGKMKDFGGHFCHNFSSDQSLKWTNARSNVHCIHPTTLHKLHPIAFCMKQYPQHYTNFPKTRSCTTLKG